MVNPMTRTQRQIRVPGAGADQVRSFCLAWLTNNGFRVIDQYADGTEKRYPIWGQQLFIHPTQGSLVAVSGKLSGAVVFELLFYPAGPETVLYVMGYAAGAGPLFHGKEYEFTSSAMAVGGVPRKRGLDLLERLEKDLIHAAAPTYPQYAQPPAQPTGPYSPPPAQPPTAYPTPQAPPTAPYYPPPGAQPAPPSLTAPPPATPYGPPPGVPAPSAPATPSPQVVQYYPPAGPVAPPFPSRPVYPATGQPAYPPAGQPGLPSAAEPAHPTPAQWAAWSPAPSAQPTPAVAVGAPAPVSVPAPAAPTPAVPTPTLPTCISCGRPATFIPQYGRFYCYPCARYI
jgi:hypothetical protein